MVSLISFQKLQHFAAQDFRSEFQEINAMQQPQIPVIGELIPNDAYLTSMTPVQRKKTIAISILVVAILATAALIAIAILLKRKPIFWGLIPSGAGTIGAGLATIYYCNRLDLDSPKRRQKESEVIRTHRLTLSQVNKRYGNFSIVAGHQLMGPAPRASYEQAALLSQKQERADHIYESYRLKIQNAYDDAIRPARRSLDRAQDAQLMGTMATITAPQKHQLLPVMATVSAYGAANSALVDLHDTVRAVSPVYGQAMEHLNLAYQEINQTLSTDFRALPLN